MGVIDETRLGKPPRVSTYRKSARRAFLVAWRGIKLRILDIPSLVATKKTNRDTDYVSIRLLAELVYEAAQEPGVAAEEHEMAA